MLLRHPILSLTTLAYLAIVGWLTLSPQAAPVNTSLLWRLAEFFGRHSATDWITFSLLEFVANIALFVPFGLFFVLLLGRRLWWLAIALGLLATAAIEFAQQYIVGRVSDPRDLVANATGAVLGALLALVLTTAKARRIAAAREAAA